MLVMRKTFLKCNLSTFIGKLLMESKLKMTTQHFSVVCLTRSHSVSCDCNRHDIHWYVGILKLFLTLYISLSLINVMFVYFLFKRKVDAYLLWLFSDLICIPCIAYKTFNCVVTADSQVRLNMLLLSHLNASMAL